MSVVVDLVPQGTFRAEVAARLRQAIAARNIKKSDVAAWVEMNVTSFSKRLNGHLPMDLDEIDSIADAAGILRDWLLTGAGPMLDPDWRCPQQGSNLRPAD
ncbi:helix-turn-helix domain-containing protein [Mycobacterium sp. SMC-11]|uniref:helix-turn-helix domain-containing protein n=1 Tax=Mycobacterium sp. SMC-11 TaxID=3385969 RepID=UPI00390C4642